VASPVLPFTCTGSDTVYIHTTALMVTFIEAHRGERTQFWPIKLCYSGGNLLSADNDCCFCLYSGRHLTPLFVAKYATNPNGVFISANSRILLLLLDFKLVEQHFAVLSAHMGWAGLVLVQKQCCKRDFTKRITQSERHNCVCTNHKQVLHTTKSRPLLTLSIYRGKMKYEGRCNIKVSVTYKYCLCFEHYPRALRILGPYINGLFNIFFNT
jgi:hypothetical protein